VCHAIHLASTTFSFTYLRQVGILGRGGGLDRQPRGVYRGVVETRFGITTQILTRIRCYVSPFRRAARPVPRRRIIAAAAVDQRACASPRRLRRRTLLVGGLRGVFSSQCNGQHVRGRAGVCTAGEVKGGGGGWRGVDGNSFSQRKGFFRIRSTQSHRYRNRRHIIFHTTSLPYT
jgi:hypothetical protein